MHGNPKVITESDYPQNIGYSANVLLYNQTATYGLVMFDLRQTKQEQNDGTVQVCP